eukprot:c23623_g1_i2 orf=515-1936(-)
MRAILSRREGGSMARRLVSKASLPTAALQYAFAPQGKPSICFTIICRHVSQLGGPLSSLPTTFPKQKAVDGVYLNDRLESASIPVSLPRVRLKRDRGLDRVMEGEKHVRPILKLRDLIMKSRRKTFPVRFLYMKKKELGLKMSIEKLQWYIQRFPNIFELYLHPKENLQWIRLTQEAMDLIEEENRIHAEQERVVVEKLSKLLMMSSGKRIPMYILDVSKRYFGFPDDFETSIIPKYPELFCLVQAGKGELKQSKNTNILQLVKWDEKLAITEFVKKAKEQAFQNGLGEIETSGKALEFKFSYSRGMQIRKKILEKYDRWQKLPYISPYLEESSFKKGTLLAEKRTVALLHELVSLTIEKRIELKIIGLFQKDYGLPANFVKWINRFPGIFYVCIKGDVCTVLLREFYERSQLIEASPLHQLKAKYAKMVQQGPRLRSILLRVKAKNQNQPRDLSEEEWSTDSSDEEVEVEGE